MSLENTFAPPSNGVSYVGSLPPMKRHPSVADIARELNVSKASVAAALSGRGGNTRVSEKTAERVREVARQLNYRSNASARAMSQQRFNTIGFFVAKKQSSDYSMSDVILNAIVDAAEKHGMTVLLVGIPTMPEGMSLIPRSLNENCLDALIIQNAMTLSAEFQAAIEASKVPVVYMNEKAPNNAVYVDDVESGRIMTRHLVDTGFRKIGILAPVGAFPHYSAVDRVKGYLEVMARAGLSPMVKEPLSPVWRDVVREWVQSVDRPEVIFCISDQIALSVQQILYDLHLRVPDDIAIAGCNDEIFAHHSPVPLTTLHVPFAEMSRVSMEQVMKLVEKPGTLPSVVLHSHLVVRASTHRQSR